MRDNFKKTFLWILILLISSYLLSPFALATDLTGLFKEGRKLYDAGRYKEAIEVFKKVSQLQPDNVPLYSVIGDCYYKDGQYEKAEDYYNQALTLAPKDCKTRYLLGHVYEKMGLFDKALLQYKNILMIEPSNQEAIIKIKAMHSVSLKTMIISSIYMLLAMMVPILISYFAERFRLKKERDNSVPIWASPVNIVIILASWGLCYFFFGMAFSKIIYDDYLVFLFFSSVYEKVKQLTRIITSAIFIFLPLYMVIHSGDILEDIGIKIKNLKKSLYLGLGGGIFIVILGFLFTLIFAKGNLSISNKLSQSISLSKTNLFLSLFSTGLIVPIGEEVFFRGFVYNIFKKRVGILLAFILSSLLFALWHGMSNLIVLYFFYGIIYIFLYESNRSLVAPIIAHVLNNLIAILNYLVYF